MLNKAQTYLLLAKVLSLDVYPGRVNKVAKILQHENVNWNGFVQLGSKNMILPAIALKVKQNSLSAFIPPDLDTYLADVLELNRERNRRVINQARYVNDLLKREGINCLFMKGTGNILDGIYSDVGERMVYDLDILVEDKNMLPAAELLRKEGFITQKEFNPRALESTMHYPILLREDLVAGVEVHRMPTQFLYQKKFRAGEVFSQWIPTKREKGFRVMNYRHRIIHNFLHAQLMHSGHYHGDVSLRDLYDLLLLGRKDDLLEVFNSYGYYLNPAYGYLKLMYRIFAVDMPPALEKDKRGMGLLKRHARVQRMTNRQLNRYHIRLLFLQKYVVLPLRVLWNRKARNYVFARLTNWSWYGRHIRDMKRRLGRK